MDYDEANDKCGVIGVSMSGHGAAPYIYLGLRALQHRGQESAGMATWSSHAGLYQHKSMGAVHEIFNRDAVESLRGSVGIGHVRYATTGRSSARNAQPVIIPTIDREIAIGHNGDIVNFMSVKKSMQREGTAFFGSADTEVMGQLISYEYSQTHSMPTAIRRAMGALSGAYAIAMLHGNTLYAFRDPNGIRPLCLGALENGYAVASESVAIELMGGGLIRDIEPGEIVMIEKGQQPRSYKSQNTSSRAHCMFEWVYFSRPDSVLDGKLVYNVRKRIGETLARESPVKADVIVPVPDSGRPQALGFSEESGISYSEGLIKSRFVERTFILPDQKLRRQAVRMKLHPIADVFNGKRVVLLDDSIVRGTTLREIVSMVRSVGAKEVHLRIGCPPIIAPCYFGIDMKDRNDLIAASRKEAEIAQELGADSLKYLSLNGLVKSIGLPENQICMGCITAKYPLNIPQEQQRFQQSLNDF
ncbi:MAG: amidophosphoribosyltransferase [Candidatus Marsarchaeota archaeon]|nr:amidophosphoribosyltransferase [Candidatus Marsarchaeota archaeon]